MACTAMVYVDAAKVPASVIPLYEAANRRFVDVHNYLKLAVPRGDLMIVDATWPLSAELAGMPVNKTFILGQDQIVAASPLQTWSVPHDRDPQEFKEEILRTHFTPDELEFREVVIRFMADKASND